MKAPKGTKKKPKKSGKPTVADDEKVCFVISPIGKTGTEHYDKFKEVMDYVIKPAVKNSGYKLQVVRADDIERAGSFIKDILQSLLDSFVVVADLSGKNPNVFYELGVRHSLSPRTILIAQSLEDIPSDLREYRTIVYDTTAKGAATFQSRLTKYLEEIYAEPDRPDNPVLDRLGSILQRNRAALERENVELRKQMQSILKTGSPVTQTEGEERVRTRVERIIKLIRAERLYVEYVEFVGEDGEPEQMFGFLPEQGHFELYKVPKGEEGIQYLRYLAMVEDNIRWDRDFADIRVLMGNMDDDLAVPCKFIIVTNADVAAEKKRLETAFDKMKSFIKDGKGQHFELEIWDKSGLLEKEKELGIKVDV